MNVVMVNAELGNLKHKINRGYNMTKVMNWIETKYKDAFERKSDMNEHLPTLKSLGEECNHITEMGIRGGVSTYGLLLAKPKKYIGYDIEYCEIFNEAKENCKEYIDITFIKANTLDIEIEESDLLMIDTYHTYDQLRDELKLHSDKVKKYIVMHDTVTFAHKPQSLTGPPANKEKGLWDAVQEFIDKDDCKWKIKKHYTNCNGLTVLGRK